VNYTSLFYFISPFFALESGLLTDFRLPKNAFKYMNSMAMAQAAKRTTLKKEVSMMWEKPPDNKIDSFTGERALC
jgi:hypothetical protein